MFYIEKFKKETIKVPLFLYLFILIVYNVSELMGIVKVNVLVKQFAFSDVALLFILYVFYIKDKISYKVFIYCFSFSIFLILNFIIIYNTHIVYRSMWIIALIPFIFLYAGRIIGLFFSVYFLLDIIFLFKKGMFPGINIQDLYAFIFSDVMVTAISYFFMLHLKNYTSSVEKKQKDLETQANTDALTEVYNRRGFFNEIKSKRGVLGIFDLDNFKVINDIYGHKFGDEYLKFFTDFLKQHIRKSDIMGRIGGDEFVVLFFDTDMQDMEIWVEKFYKELGEKRFKGLKVSVSSGFSLYENDLKESFIKADKCLYKAKKDKGTFSFE